MQRSAFAAAALYSVVTLILVAPILGRFSSVFPHDAADPVLNSWLLAWSARHLPLSAEWWNAGMFYPAPNAMALSETLLGLLPITTPVLWITGSATAAYNAAFVLSFPLCGLAAYALARELTGRSSLAMVAGLAYAFAPYRGAQLAHLQVLSYYWAPLALLGLHVYLRTARTSALVLFAVSWLMQALTNGYALFHLSILIALWMAWFVRTPRALASIAVAWAAAAVPLVPIVWRYWQVHTSWHLARDVNEIRRFGLDFADLFRAPDDLIAWGGRLGIPRPETAAFPGITVIAIGVVAALLYWQLTPRSAAKNRWDRRLLIAIAAIAALAALSTLTIGPWELGRLTVTDFHKPFTIAVFARTLAFLRGGALREGFQKRSVWLFYALAMAAMYVLALGPEPRLLGRPMLYEPPYAWFMRLPGFDTLRVPARFVMLAVLCQSMLLAAAIGFLTRLIEQGPALRHRGAAVLVAGVLAGICVDGAFRLPAAAAPRAAPALPDDVQALVEAPPGDPDVDLGALYRSIGHQRAIANGYSGYAPAHYLPLAVAARDGHYDAVRELSSGGPLGVLVDTTRPDAAAIGERLAAIGGTRRVLDDPSWQLFVVPPASEAVTSARGTSVPIAAVTATHEPDHVDLLRDGDIRTAWGTGIGQAGGETLTVTLERTTDVSGIVLQMGAFAFGFPRELTVETSADGQTWQRRWNGPTDVLTVRGALADLANAPLVIEFAASRARFVRLVQQGAEPGIPWWIAELQVF
jgi:hypothetical protein